MNRSIEPPYQTPYFITIGVTGHRTLPPESISAIRETLRRILNDIKARHSCTGQTPFSWQIVTPLAEGADRLVADEIMKRPEGAVLKAILPLTVSDYIDDFATEDSKEEFFDLMDRGRPPIILKKCSLKDVYAPESRKEARRQAYDEAGKFVVDQSDILIALWDGQESRGKGGTADIIAYADQKKCPRYTILTNVPDRFEFTNDRKDG